HAQRAVSSAKLTVMQRRSKAVSKAAAAAHSEPDFSLEACRRCLSEIGSDLAAFVAAPDGAADAGAAGRLSRSFSQLNWMMSSHGTKWKPELKADLRTVEQEMLDSGLVTSLVDLLLTLLRLRGAYDDLAVRVLLCLLNCTDRSLEFCLQFAKSQDKFFRSYFPDLLNAQDGGQMLELNTASLVECALGIGYNMYFKNDSELYRRLAEFPGMVDSAKPYLVSPVTRVSATALIFIAFAVGDSQAEIFLGAKKSINYLISILRLGLKAPERACDGYSVAEMSKCINRLALNDANKDLLVELNVLSVVKLMLDSPEAQDVQEGLEILFTLSFSQRAAERIKTEFRRRQLRLVACLATSNNCLPVRLYYDYAYDCSTTTLLILVLLLLPLLLLRATTATTSATTTDNLASTDLQCPVACDQGLCRRRSVTRRRQLQLVACLATQFIYCLCNNIYLLALLFEKFSVLCFNLIFVLNSTGVNNLFVELFKMLIHTLLRSKSVFL
ncbi:hypothetical protein BOX15_Mlig029014g1, partial [Macrostomum lignano]